MKKAMRKMQKLDKPDCQLPFALCPLPFACLSVAVVNE
jgi:hypothetical protein